MPKRTVESIGIPTVKKLECLDNLNIQKMSSPPIESQELPEFLEIQAFSPSSGREILFVVLCIFSFGTLPILCHWYPQLYTWIRRQNASLGNGEYVLVRGLDKSFTEIPVFDVQSFGNWNEQSQLLSETDAHSNTRYFDYRRQRYVYRESIGAFIVCSLSI